MKMNRQRIVEKLLLPMDLALGAALELLRAGDAFDQASNATYWFLRAVLRTQFIVRNELEVEGVEHVPVEGGFILASNHQSWLDVQVLGSACPRRIYFVAKSEFRHWPVMRHLIDLSQSLFVQRGGDKRGLEAINSALERGKAVAIYPEGTIPGEEEITRREVDPSTGLLRGKTGAVRLAIESRVPIIPVGVSGTGRAFPPEIYPRLEILRLPASTPIRIRFGEPLDLSQYHEKELSHEHLRELTNDLMRRISALVDHRSNYAPIEVPIPPARRSANVAVLLLHGFTSSTDTVDGLIPYLKKEAIPFERPILRGHGTRYQDLRGVRSRDWYVDAERALIKLYTEGYRVIVVGLSMGGLVALDLAARHPEMIAGVITVAAALKFVDPMAGAAQLADKFVRYLPSPNSFVDPELAKRCTNYKKFPVDAFASLYRYSRRIAERLPDVHVPICVLQSKADQIVAPRSANIIYEKVSSPLRQIVWFEKSGHEMMQDCEAEAVFAEIVKFISSFRIQSESRNDEN
ncbi:MAG: alpha/beta fold hydrolase [Deltaproteobacteria bacterium]|nr:alpha/beta fold hydrolase [Deltaproteobacteria bacterium]